ncbi:MauE/DoxX family redox-associated membrane protein [Ekhidna sp.]|uniref:DoxX family protein n=1 Tax=Ekhidna sp. TaxID=2608089 RepID=UPI003BA98DD1
MKKLSTYIQGFFYLIAGLNHFINPDFYLPLIPEYFMFPESINYLAGFFEVVFGVMLFFDLTRKTAAYLIVTMLVAFIISHVYFIQLGSCIEGGLCVPQWIGWLRLLIIHPILIWWALSVRNSYFFTRITNSSFNI